MTLSKVSPASYCVRINPNLFKTCFSALFFSRENVQRLQQDLAHMILICLERRSKGSIRRKETLSVRQRKDTKEQEWEVESEGEQPEYLHLATVDNTLSTFL